MTLKQLETLYWVHRLGGFAAAAERLHSTQSAVSMRIQDLETSLGVALFDRSLRSARLSAKGQELVKYAERLLQLTAEIRHRIGDPQVITGPVRLGVTEFVALTWLPNLVMAINERYPGITVELDVDLKLNQIQKLKNGDLDMTLVPGPIDEPGLANVSCGAVEFVWMASPKLGLPRRRLSARDLQQWPLITLTHQSNLHKLLGEWFDRSDAVPRRVDVCNSIGALGSFTLAGLGVSFLPRQHFRKEIQEGRLQVLTTTPRLPDLEYFAVYDKRRAQPLVPTIAELAAQYTTFALPAASGGIRTAAKRKSSRPRTPVAP